MNAFQSCVAVTGASSFIGRHLVRALLDVENIELRLLLHRTSPLNITDEKTNITIVSGDLMDTDSLKELLKPGCIVVNLAYIPNASLRDHLQATTHLAYACRAARIKRLVHCSTAVVVGSAAGHVITEETPCKPSMSYEQTKLQIESLFKKLAWNNFELAILRPTAVFGVGGKNLQRLAEDLIKGHRFINYIKSCLYNHRRMNLVPVDHVVASLLFLAKMPRRMNGETYIISHDDAPQNNYRDIEKYLMHELGCQDYSFPRLPLPWILLVALLKLAGRSNINPKRTYSSQKILDAGFKRPISFEAGLDRFVNAFQIRSSAAHDDA